MPVKRSSMQEPIVFLRVMVPFSIIVNLLIFGTCILTLSYFLKSFGLSVVTFSIIYGVFSYVAVLIKNRNPGTREIVFAYCLLLIAYFP